MLSNKLPFVASIATPFEQLGAFQKQLVCDEGDKFAVGRLFVGGVNLYAEHVVDVLDFASVPSNLDCVAYGAFHFRRGRLIPCGDAGVELFCDRVDDFGRFNGHFDGFAQELIAFYMRGDAHRNKEVCDSLVQSFVLAHVDLRARCGARR